MRNRTRSLLLLVILAAPLHAQDAKVETQLLLAPDPGVQYEISPKGQHVGAVVLRGSRQVLAYDGADGPKFDQVLRLSSQTSGGGMVAWSDDGARYAYHGKLGQEYVVLVDGKEVTRGPWSANLQAQGRTPVYQLGFTPGGKHWYVIIETQTTGRQNYQMILDGVTGPLAQDYITPLWSPDGEHHTYIQKIATATMSEPRYVLIVDGKPAPYLAGDMQWTGDSKHLITKRVVPGTANVEVLADGQPIMRAPGGPTFTMAPVGPAMLGVASAQFPGGTRGTFLLVGTRKAVGSECTNSGGLDGIYMSADAKHYAARCAMSFMYVDGKKGQEYPEGLSNLLFTADGRPVYYGRTNQRVFMVIGEQESNAYTWIQDVPGVTREEQRAAASRPAPAVVRGNHVAYIARTNPNDGMATVVVVGGKAIPAEAASLVSLSPDGTRYAFLSGRTSSVTVDGTPYASGVVDPAIGNVGFQGVIHWSADSKHVAWITQAPNQGVAIDGRYVAAPGWTRFLSFSADGKHVVWLVRGQGSEHQVFLDGIKVLTIPQNLPLENEADIYWGFAPDGSITFVAQDNDGMKRFRIVPGGTSVETAAAKGTPIR
jgi:hypothetical protein